MPKPKYRLHGLKVDRIAVVDNPAVPDATIVLFKRRTDNQFEFEKIMKQVIEKNDFGQMLGVFTLDGALQALEQAFFGAMFGNPDQGKEERVKDITNLLNDFSKVALKLIAIGRSINKQAPEEPTPQEVVDSFERSIAMKTIVSAFDVLRSHVAFFASSQADLADVEKGMKALLKVFRETILTIIDDVLEKRATVSLEELEKVGRKISGARMRRIKNALAELTQILSEVEAAEKRGLSIELEDGMNQAQEKALKDAVAAIGLLEVSVKTLTEEKGSLVSKVSGLEENFVKYQKDSGEAIGTLKAEFEKSIAELKKTVTQGFEGTGGAKEELVKRFEKTEALIEKMSKVYEAIAKKMGLSNSLEIEKGGEGDDEGKKDPFHDAMKSTYKVKKELTGTA